MSDDLHCDFCILNSRQQSPLPKDSGYLIHPKLFTWLFWQENTYVYNGSAIVGITPQINTSATDNFKTGLNSQGGAQRRRRQTVTDQPSDNLYDPINSETLEFFIGI